MAQRINLSQFKSKIRQLEQKQRQAIDKYNRDVRAYNQKVKQAVGQYNREARAHNARVHANRQRLKSEVAKLARQKTTTQYVTFRTSVSQVQGAYEAPVQNRDTDSR